MKPDHVASNHIVNKGAGANLHGGVMRFSAPTETGEVLLSHTEFVSKVYGPTTAEFENTAYDLNPGLDRAFQWLSAVAGSFTSYEFIQLAFTFKSTVSEFTTTTGTVGTVNFAVQYDFHDPAFTTFEAMSGDISFVSVPTTEGMCVGIECDPKKLPRAGGDNIKFIRCLGLRPDDQQINFDHARLNIATDGFPSVLFNQPIGELWVSYTCRLRRPNLDSMQGLCISKDLWANLQNVPIWQGAATPAAGSANLLQATASLLSNRSLAQPNGSAVERNMLDARDGQLLRSPLNSIQTILSAPPRGGTMAQGFGLSTATGGDGWWSAGVAPGAVTAGDFNSQFGNNIFAKDIPLGLGDLPLTNTYSPLVITFPADYTGDVEVKICWQLVQIDLSSGTPTSGFQTPFADQAPGGLGICRGIVDPIYDMCAGVGGDQAGPLTEFKNQMHAMRVGFTQCNNVNGGRAFITLVARLRVAASKGGVDNSVAFLVTVDSAANSAGIVDDVEVVVSEYNSAFQNSTKDPAPVLIDNSSEALITIEH